MPNQWARSQKVQCQLGVSHKTINAKPMATISKGSMSIRHKHTKLSMPNQWARSQRVQFQPDGSHKTINAKPMGTISKGSMSARRRSQNYQCKIKRHNLVSCSLRRGTNYSYHCNQSEVFCI